MQLEAAGAVVMTLIGGVLLGRVRRDRSRRNLLLATALLVLAVANLFASIATPVVDSLSLSTFATWTAAGGGAFGALLLVSASVVPERSLPRGRGAEVLAVAAGGLGLGAIALASAMLGGWLPAAFENVPTSADQLRSASEHPALLAVELLTAAGCAAAAWRLAVLADTEGDKLWRWMAVGIAVAAVAFVNYALVPSQFTELLYSGDFFFLLAIAVLLWGAIVAISEYGGDARAIGGFVGAYACGRRAARRDRAGARVRGVADGVLRRPADRPSSARGARRVGGAGARRNPAGRSPRLCGRSTSPWLSRWVTPPGMPPPALALAWS